MAGTYKLRRNKLACVSSKFISLKHSLTRVFDVRYMDILFVRPDNNCVQITQIDMLIRNFAWRTFDFLRNYCA